MHLSAVQFTNGEYFGRFPCPHCGRGEDATDQVSR
jgi:predicted RNA-binding Zn-ribbon protein involved in translation (DUF1610 family)